MRSFIKSSWYTACHTVNTQEVGKKEFSTKTLKNGDGNQSDFAHRRYTFSP